MFTSNATPNKADHDSKFIVIEFWFQIADSGPYGDNSCVYLPLDAMEI